MSKSREISICPFRTYTETIPAILKGQSDFVRTEFMPCLKNKCPAFYTIRANTFIDEHCKRLELI